MPMWFDADAPPAGGAKPEPATIDKGYFVNQWLDVMDTVDNWCEAQVIDMSPNGSRIRVHYKGWKSHFDEWLDVEAHSHRIAPLHRHTDRPDRVGQVVLDVGVRCDVLDSSDKWLQGVVLEMTDSQVKIHYKDWSSKYDEWLNKDSYRLAPLHSRTQPVHVTAPWRPQNKRSLSMEPLAQAKRTRLTVDRPSAMEENRFVQLLQKECALTIVDMAADGNCLFRSVSHQVYGTAAHHALVRQKCIRYMKNQSQYFQAFVAEKFDDYVRAKQKDGEWGDHVEIQAMAELYGRSVEIYACNTKPITFGMSRARPIRLSYHSRSHFNSVVPLSGHSPLLDSSPGVFEDRRISLFMFNPNSVQQVQALSDVEATDKEAILAALALSRQDFSRSSSALQATDEQLKEILQKSLREFEEMNTKKVVEKLQEAELKSAVDASLQSLSSDPGGAAGALALGAADESKAAWPPEVRYCHVNMMFPLERCIEAYSVCHDESQPSSAVQTHMVNYLLAT